MNGVPEMLIIPAAGRGTRMREVASGAPKEMLPLGAKPAIQYALEEGMAAGIAHVVLVIRREKEVIRRYFEDGGFAASLHPEAAADVARIRARCRITFLYQETPTGEADALALAREHAGGGAIAVLYPDNFHLPPGGAFKGLLAARRETGLDCMGLMEMTARNAPLFANAGRVDAVPWVGVSDGLYRIGRFHAKTPGRFRLRGPRDLRGGGIYVFGPHLFETLARARAGHQGGEFTDGPVLDLILKERGLAGCILPGVGFDLGNPDGYRAAVRTVREG